MRSHILFTNTAIDAPERIGSSREIGACVEFQGIVRELENGNALEGLYYEAYESMARIQLERIFAELNARFPVESVLFIHRLGWVPVGEPSLFVRIESAHRAEALSFCGAAIDRMKEDVPIWKRCRAA